MTIPSLENEKSGCGTSYSRISGEPTQQQGKSIGRYLNTTTLQQHQAAAVVSSVKAARSYLVNAQFTLDDAGFHCQRLDDLQDGAATLLADWSGRRRPGFGEPVPAYIAAAAIEWRRAAKRSY
ncbi:hypothetical protein [Mesorhizobium sp.]|uniref:hypothetical protein n=1 Tax=Mesorhizobium sp. TaxID=1871066 RepID=UPI000FE6E085|nr:hypothetical protein [Mesorhizobium sp.]RWA62121.1 MAG: hypothetical protein EOQ27_15660 [Mesorhizobium sp.]